MFNFSPRGTGQQSMYSRTLTGQVKSGKRQELRKALSYIHKNHQPFFNAFLHPDAVLVPVPRSAPLVDGALWPGRVLCDMMVELGMANRVMPALTRVTAIPKSHGSGQSADQRPGVRQNWQSLRVNTEIIAPGTTLTIVDDVLTLGRTLAACYFRLKEVFPDADIRCLAVMRTQGLVAEIDQFIEPVTGIINYNRESGKTSFPTDAQ